MLWKRRREEPAAPIQEFNPDLGDEARFRQIYTGELAKIFFSGDNRLIHKWVHYLPIYERHFAPYRGSALRFLEIGVSQGGSLDMWRKYFGPQAVIYGIDVDPVCAARVDPPNQVRIGSQDDEMFLRSVAAEMGGVDIVLDDGSHIASHQRATFQTLFPLVSDGGLYVIEDTHTAYWAPYEGGYGRKGTAVDIAKQLIDDLHGWFHKRPAKLAETDRLGGVHTYDSMIIIDKVMREKPRHLQIKPKD
jgi:hypothetical protein